MFFFLGRQMKTAPYLHDFRFAGASPAAIIPNARAFEELVFLKPRLKEENNYLREEVTSAFGCLCKT